jgi:hypothetical protein
MESSLPNYFYDQRIVELIRGIHEVVSSSNKDNLEERIIGYFHETGLDDPESESMQLWQQLISNDLRVRDQTRNELMFALANYVFGCGWGLNYLVSSRCKADKQAKKNGKKSKAQSCGQFFQVMPIDEPIFEEDLESGLILPILRDKQYNSCCPVCNSNTEIISTSTAVFKSKGDTLTFEKYGETRFVQNVVWPIAMILSRVKSSGSFIDKILDNIFFDYIKNTGTEEEKKKAKKRSLHDELGFTIVLNSDLHPDGYNRLYKQQFGRGIRHDGSFEQEISQAIIPTLQSKFEIAGEVQNNYGEEKKNNIASSPDHKMVQADILYRKLKMELKIITLTMYGTEQDKRTSAYHPTYKEIERRFRDELYARNSAYFVVRRILGQLRPERRVCQ